MLQARDIIMIGAICGTIGIAVGTWAGATLCDCSKANPYDDTPRGRSLQERDTQLGIYPFDWDHQDRNDNRRRKEPC